MYRKFRPKCWIEKSIKLNVFRGFWVYNLIKNVAMDRIFHLANAQLMGSDPDRVHERSFFLWWRPKFPEHPFSGQGAIYIYIYIYKTNKHIKKYRNVYRNEWTNKPVNTCQNTYKTHGKAIAHRLVSISFDLELWRHVLWHITIFDLYIYICIYIYIYIYPDVRRADESILIEKRGKTYIVRWMPDVAP